MKKHLKQKLYYVVVALALTTSGFSQEEGGGDVDDTGTPPAAPIDNYVPVALIAAAGLGYVLLRKKSIKL